MGLTAENARALAGQFRDLSSCLGKYRYDHWDELGKGNRDKIENAEWSLLNSSSDLITRAVGLDLDTAKTSLDQLSRATTRAKKAIQTIKEAKKVVRIGLTAVVLAAALVTKYPAAIADAAATFLGSLAS